MPNDVACEHKRVLMVGTSIGTRGGIASVVATLRDNGLFERCGVDYVASHCDGSAARKAAQAASGWLKCVTRLVGGKVRCLHVHLASHASFWRKLLFILPAYLLRVPVVLHLHGAEFHIFVDQECGALGKWWVRWVFRRSSCAIVLSESWARWLRATVPGVKVRVIYNPVALPAPSEVVRDREAILFLGRLGERKGTFVLLEAVSRLAKRGVCFKLWLGGDGDIEAVRERASELGIADRVELLGWVGGEKKSQLLARAGIYCLPSYNEGLPISVLEAMAAGMPVVTTPVGGIPEALSDGAEGYLVAPGNAEELADRLGTLLNDRELAEQMGGRGRRRVSETFSADVIVPQVEAVYRSVLRD